MLWTDRRAILVIALFLGLFLDLGTAPLFDRDEGAFSEATREMITSGDFISPTLNFEPRYDKPILIYWLQAATVRLVGVNEWGFRLPSALATLAWVIVAMLFVAPRFGGRSAAATGLILATSLGTMMLGRAAIADAVLNLWLALAFFDFWRWEEEGKRSSLLRSYFWIGLGILTKGPVAIIIPFGVTLLYYLSLKRWKSWLPVVFEVRGWLISLLVSAPWYWMQFEREGRAFWDGFFMRHNIERFSSQLEGHGGSLLFYLPVILVVALPFTGLLLSTAGRIHISRKQPLSRFLWCWFFFVILFFTFSGTKLIHYVLLGFTPLALLMGQNRDGLRSMPLLMLPPLLLWGALLALPSQVEAIRERIDDRYFSDLLAEAPSVFDVTYLVGVGVVIATILVASLWPRRRRWESLVTIALVQALVLAHIVVPTFGELLQGPVKEAALMAKELGEPTVRTGVDLPSVSVYRELPTARRRPETGELAVTTIEELDGWNDVEVLFRRGAVVLLRQLEPQR